MELKNILFITSFVPVTIFTVLTRVRFLIPGIRLPFVYYIEFDSSGKIQSEGFT